MFPKVTLVLGGASSGKSAYAEKLVISAEKPMIYLATAEACDAEMTARIARHRQSRGAGWRTIEEPLRVAHVLGKMRKSEVALLDCATLWLSNHFSVGSDLPVAQADLLDAVANCPARLVVVSNEVGLGGVPDNSLARRFGRAQGTLNAALAHRADLVVLVTAGLPQVLKGHLPP